MTQEQCVAFLEALRAKQIHVKGNGWIEASCPLAPWTHKNRMDSSPSFGLSVRPGERSHFLCFACRQGSAEELLQTIEFYSGLGMVGPKYDYNFPLCHQILQDEEYVIPLPEYGEFGPPGQQFSEWPQYWVDSFTHAAWDMGAAKYLAFRGVSVTTMAQFDLRYDPKRQMIVAPYRDVFNRLAGARGRSLHEGAGKHYDYTYQGVNNARFCWYNEPVLNLHGPVVVVEGQFDCWKTVQVFPKTVANLTAKPTMEKMKKLGDCGLVIQIPDRDEAGRESVQRYAALCAQLGLDHRPIWLGEGVKDPAECHVEYLRDRIQEACN